LDNIDIKILGNVDLFDYGWPLLIIAVGVFLIYRDSRRRSGADSEYSEFKILGDSSHTGFSGEIHGTDISHFIGDTDLNLAGAQLKSGINTLNISAFIGDIEVIVPENMAVEVHCSAAISDLFVLGRKESGLFTTTTERSPGYETAEKKLHINCSVFIGDIKIRQLAIQAGN
jgi:lia operon protein LiaF